MRVLAFLHHLELGGSQTNGIELAAATRDLYGHEVTVMAAPGPALALVERHGLRLVPAPAGGLHPSPAVARVLRQAVRDLRIDLVHAWEWPQCVDAFYAVGLWGTVPLVGTDMSMAYNARLPGSVPLTYGTSELVAAARARRSGPVTLLEPPVDVHANAPGAVDPMPFRVRHGLDGDGRVDVVIVSRLVEWMKLEGILRAIEAVERLADLPVRLTIVGGGTAFDRVAWQAEAANRRVGRPAILAAGPMVDPRAAYAAADVVLGMGGSILRAMAFGKPCIVLGEGGFSEPFTPETSGRFLWHGFYGVGGRGAPAGDLAGQLAPLVQEPALRAELGAYARRVVEERFSIEHGAQVLDQVYDRALWTPRTPPARATLDAAGTGLRQVVSGLAGLQRAGRPAGGAR